MASTRQLRSRIRSVKGSRQITKAMELVAASKLRRAQEASRATNAYAQAAREVLSQLSAMTDVARTVYFAGRTVRTRLVILITSDRGLAGAYNANAIKAFVASVRSAQAAGIATEALCIGKKGAQFVAKLQGVEARGVYSLPEHPTAADIRPILVSVMERYFEAEADEVTLITTRFVNSFTQDLETMRLLPARFEDIAISHDIAIATFEPSVEEVLEGATIRLLEAQLFQAVLDGRASEQSMRRAAMKNASDNAGELIGDLTLEMNKVRQAAITQELSEISGGAEAMR